MDRGLSRASRAGASDRVRPAGSEPVPCRVVKGPIGLARDEPEG